MSSEGEDFSSSSSSSGGGGATRDSLQPGTIMMNSPVAVELTQQEKASCDKLKRQICHAKTELQFGSPGKLFCQTTQSAIKIMHEISRYVLLEHRSNGQSDKLTVTSVAIYQVREMEIGVIKILLSLFQSSLRTLKLWSCESLETLPEAICQCPSLEHLTMGINRLGSTTNSINSSIHQLCTLINRRTSIQSFRAICNRRAFHNVKIQPMQKLGLALCRLKQVELFYIQNALPLVETLCSNTATLESMSVEVASSYDSDSDSDVEIEHPDDLPMPLETRQLWKRKLTNAILKKNNSLHWFNYLDPRFEALNIDREVLKDHLESNKQITKAKELLNLAIKKENDSDSSSSHGIWANAIAKLTENSHGKTATYLIVRSMIQKFFY